MVEIDPYGNDFGSADRGFSVSAVGFADECAVKVCFKCFTKIIYLAEKCCKMFYVKGLL